MWTSEDSLIQFTQSLEGHRKDSGTWCSGFVTVLEQSISMCYIVFINIWPGKYRLHVRGGIWFRGHFLFAREDGNKKTTESLAMRTNIVTRPNGWKLQVWSRLGMNANTEPSPTVLLSWQTGTMEFNYKRTNVSYQNEIYRNGWNKWEKNLILAHSRE